MIVRVYRADGSLKRKTTVAKLQAKYSSPEHYNEEILDALGELERQEEFHRVVSDESGFLELKIKLTPKNWRYEANTYKISK